jgi:amino acid transporter
MKRVSLITLIFTALLLVSILGTYLLPRMLLKFDLILRQWTFLGFSVLTTLSAVALAVMLWLIFARIKKTKKSAKAVRIGAIIYLPVCALICAISFLLFWVFTFPEWVETENGVRYVYQHDANGASYADRRYEYVNWFVRGREPLNLPENH